MDPWGAALRRLSLGQPRIPVFSPMERGWYGPHSDLAALLPSHFVRPLLFHEALDDLYALGGRTFIECGGGKTLTGLVSKAFPAAAEVQVVSAFHPAGSFGSPSHEPWSCAVWLHPAQQPHHQSARRNRWNRWSRSP